MYVFILAFAQPMFSLTSIDILTLNPIGRVYIDTVLKENFLPDRLLLGITFRQQLRELFRGRHFCCIGYLF